MNSYRYFSEIVGRTRNFRTVVNVHGTFLSTTEKRNAKVSGVKFQNLGDR
jgi:hypothetical protein